MQFWGSVAPGEARRRHPQSTSILADAHADYGVRGLRERGPDRAGRYVGARRTSVRLRDILAITVNRWPHGYAYDYLDLWDPRLAVGGGAA